MSQIRDDQPSLYIAPVVQAEDPPLSCRTLTITIHLFSTFHRHSSARHEPSQVHQRSMSLGLTLDADTKAQALKINSVRLKTPRRWVSFSFKNSYGLRFGSFSTFLTLSSSTNPNAYWFLLLHLHFRLRCLSFYLPSNVFISFVLRFPPLPLLRPPFDFDKLNSLIFPNSLFLLSVMLSRSSPGQVNVTFRILSSLGCSHTCLEIDPNHPRS